MPDPLLYLKATATAAIVSTLFVLTMAKSRRSIGDAWRNSACVLGIGFGLYAGYHVLSWRLAWPPFNALDRLLTVVLPAVLCIELVAGFRSVPRWLAWLFRLSLAATASRILLHDSVYLTGADGRWTSPQTASVLLACGVLLASLWSLLSWLSRRTPGVSVPFALGMAAQCAGVTVMMAGYIKGGAAAFPLTVTLVAVSFAVWLVARQSETQAKFDTSPIVGIGVVGLFSLLFIGRFFGELSVASTLAMLLAPLLCWVTEIPFLRNRKPWIVGVVRFALVAIPLVVVLVAAKRDFDRDMAPLLVQSGAVERSTLATPVPD
ncbi:MAG: hypothetical protein ACI8P0_001344 [Planctomycetaceae bacterium]|jgi:hypothetical protein